MNLFEMNNGVLQIQPEAYALEPFKVLWTRDKTKNKDNAIKELSFVYFMVDFTSDFADILEDSTREIEVKKSSWEVKCNYIPKILWEEGYYPLEEVVPNEEYQQLNIIEKTKLQYKFNKLLWAKHKLGWSVYNPKRKQDQYWQKATLLCTAKSKACRFGRRMGVTLGRPFQK